MGWYGPTSGSCRCPCPLENPCGNPDGPNTFYFRAVITRLMSHFEGYEPPPSPICFRRQDWDLTQIDGTYLFEIDQVGPDEFEISDTKQVPLGPIPYINYQSGVGTPGTANGFFGYSSVTTNLTLQWVLPGNKFPPLHKPAELDVCIEEVRDAWAESKINSTSISFIREVGCPNLQIPIYEVSFDIIIAPKST